MTEPSKRARDALDDVFGEALPQFSADERDTPSPDDEAERDRWLRENLPPHHL